MRKLIQVGDKAEMKKTFGEEDVRLFAQLSSDNNPVHLDAEFAKTTIFGKPVVHGALVTSLISGLMGRELPGRGAIYLSQRFSYKKPIFVGEEITAVVEVQKIREEKFILTLKTLCFNSAGEVAVEGEALVLVPNTHQLGT